jgi:nicotinate phosphoribosyltransferase
MEFPLAMTEPQRRLWQQLAPVNRVAATDTYKRTMSASSGVFSDHHCVYTLAARRGINEPGANGRLVMAGLEKLLYPWFLRPFTIEEIALAETFFSKYAQMKKFARELWNMVKWSAGRLPIDIYALPGGQTFLAKDGRHVPLMSVEGPGAIVTHLEPHLETAFAPIIHATKARLFREACGAQVVEFGLRSDQLTNNHVTLMLDLFVGGGIRLTSDDQAVFIFPELFQDVGTIGHEFIMAFQRQGDTLEGAQARAFKAFVAANERSSLLPDVIHTVKSGLPAILRLIQENRGSGKVIMPRFDSGDIASQCIIWKNMTEWAGIPKIQMVVEDGMTPTKGRAIKDVYSAAGFDPEDILVGAGGYFQDGCSRDAVSLVYKRSGTIHNGKMECSLKFSDSPGKESIPGCLRVYEQGDTLIVAQSHEQIDGTPLMVKVVAQGQVVYNEDINRQKERAERTWNRYERIEYSPATREIIRARTAERDALLVGV